MVIPRRYFSRLAFLLATTPATAVSQTTLADYAVKFVCGERAATQDASGFLNAVSPGFYQTAINIYNPTNERVRLTVGVATTVAAPQAGDLLAGPNLVIPPLRALEIDCAEILGAVPPADLRRTRFLKGFVVLRADREVEVVAVYTGGSDRQVATMDVETVKRRSLTTSSEQVCPDLTIGQINRPEFSPLGHTIVSVVIVNVGTQPAMNFEVTIEDPNRAGPERKASTTIGALAAGAATTVTLELTYRVTGNDNVAALVVQVDPKNVIAECREDNNRRTLGSP